MASSIALPNMASAASELWPSVSAVRKASWRAPSSAALSAPTTRPNVNRTQSAIRNSYTPSNRSFSTAVQGPRLTRIPGCLAGISSSALGMRFAPDNLRIAPTAMEVLNSVSRSSLSKPSPLMFLGAGRQSSTITPFGSLKLTSISNMRNHGLEQRRSLWGSNATNSGNSSYNLLSHMEQTANNNPTSASAQNSFYSALLRANRPELVVQRFDTGQFASNAAVEATYKKALDQVAQSEGQGGGLQSNPHVSSDHLGAVAQAIGARSRGGNSALAKSGSGAKDAPLYVVVEESYGSTIFRWVKFTAWFAFAVWIFYVIISLMVEGAGLLKRVGGINVNEAKPELQKTKFADVEGCDEAKEELQELVAFLKDPKQFSTLGGKLPKGVLLVGPPGTGKTLLARAVAGEAGVPFFYASGSEFDEMYVGVGAKRIRELFTSARAKSPAIIFIDELDAIGGKRNPRDGAYAKQTLNQLLTELDGFDQGSGIIIIAATNFPQSLDNALTRPGRFDRNVNVPLPDVRGRMAILKLKLKNMQIGTDVDLSVIARGTTGFSGADLENLANQAAVHASKRKATKIHMSDYEWAKDKILMGPERRSAVIQQKDKVMTAYHEGGHALVALLTPYATPLYKATIMPRGHALGITFQLSEMDRVSESKQEMLAQIDVCMGGKCAEILVYGEDAVTSGASSDISAATKMALAMVKQYGMSDKLGNLDLNRRELPAGMNQLIWDEVKRIIDESKERVLKLLKENRKSLDAVSQGLVDYEILDKVEMEKVIKGEKLPDRLKSAPGPIKPIEPPKITVVKPGGPPPGPADPGLGTPPPVDEPSGIPGVGVGDGTPPAGFPPVSPAASSSTKEEKTK